jgi:hypothetical protein
MDATTLPTLADLAAISDPLARAHAADRAQQLAQQLAKEYAAARRDAIGEARHEAGMSYQAIGDALGVTAQRADQLARGRSRRHRS